MNIDEEIDRMRIALARMERGGKRKSVSGRFSVGKRLRVAPITKRMRSTGVTPRTAKKFDTRTSRSRQMQPRKLSFGSETNSRSASRPRSVIIDTPLIKSVQYTQSRKVRHNNARKVLNKMPAGGKPYAKRRMTSRKPKGAYRGAVMPKWAKGETKHILANDHSLQAVAEAGSLTGSGSGVVASNGIPLAMSIGAIRAFSVNPVEQGNSSVQRNGRSIDGTYLRVQGHIQNKATSGQRAYVRMMVLAVKGGRQQGDNQDRQSAGFLTSRLYKKIDGTIVGFTAQSAAAAGSGATAVRTLQLPINKGLYTVLADQKMQLSSSDEGFGASDRLFDLKIPLKQKTKFQNEYADSFESNNIVFVVQTVDPACVDGAPPSGVHVEFESKYSYKDF